jgi:alpha-galactosidase
MNLIRRVSDVQKMTLDAVVSGDDDALFAAFLSDPLMNLSHDKASELFEKMLDASKLVY